jgi:5-methylcytosine-specific restriction endonuclease McrA
VSYGRARATVPPAQVCALTECEAEFVPVKAGQRCCSERHGKLLWNRESRADGRQAPPAWTDRRRDNHHRRRALKRAAAVGEPVVFAVVAERDRWRCGLCGKRVRADKVWPHPLSPSLDHIVPLSRGGTHEPVNVQLAHLVCNTAKGNRGAQQLPMFG